MENKNSIHVFGASRIDDKAYIFLSSGEQTQQGVFFVRHSTDGIAFDTVGANAKIVNINGPSDDLADCHSFHLSKDGKSYLLTYRVAGKDGLCFAQSKNIIDWEKIYEVPGIMGEGKIVSDYLYAARNVMYGGGDALRLYASSDLKKWVRAKRDLITIDPLRGEKVLFVVETQVVEDGVFVMYCVIEEHKGVIQYVLYGALFDYGDPTKLLWRSDQPIYVSQNTKKHMMHLVAAVVFDEHFVSYWQKDDGEIMMIRHLYKQAPDEIAHGDRDHMTECDVVSVEDGVVLERVRCNPIMTPQKHCGWESRATYNPTAIEFDGKIHIIYRAEGDHSMSVLGYAATSDGVNIDERFPHCIYRRDVEFATTPFPPTYVYTSGNNGNGGCEDPRAVLIDETIYITFTAFDGWGSIRVALTSIDLADFKKKRWRWKKTVLISPPGEINKNWVIFPEKINGKFAIFHSFYPKILIDYFDDLDELDGCTRFIKSNNTRPIDHTRTWDGWFRGVGPAPIKTEDGWLVLYHAMDHRNPDRYKIGALLLDRDDPTTVLCRSSRPILEPQEHYENNGHKWGVIYACGAVVKDGVLYVYYGGSDEFVCVATAPLRQFLDDLKKNGEVTMST
jgi:predicted GH43/DUF377 family glycosyl hydrolase